MEQTTLPQVEAPKPPLSPEAIVDMRRRVLAGEVVSDEELRHALASLAQARATASTTSSKSKTDTTYVPKEDLATRMAKFKAKQQDLPGVETPK